MKKSNFRLSSASYVLNIAIHCKIACVWVRERAHTNSICESKHVISMCAFRKRQDSKSQVNKGRKRVTRIREANLALLMDGLIVSEVSLYSCLV